MPRSDEAHFRDWIVRLREDVIQEEYGYEPGEFDVHPEMWRGLYDEGLTPAAAFRRALDDFAKHRNDTQPVWTK